MKQTAYILRDPKTDRWYVGTEWVDGGDLIHYAESTDQAKRYGDLNFAKSVAYYRGFEVYKLETKLEKV